MRKILALVLTIAMMFSTFSFAAAAPADVEGTDYEDAVVRLGALGIIAGFPDGTYRPGDMVTRAQFAKIIVTVLGIGEAANFAAGATRFADVPADHWASGYINVAADVGVVVGYPDGTFRPEKQVTYAEAIKMIVVALGYTPKAEGLGGYPGGYLAVAAEEGITKGISVISGLAANRGDVALMINNCLDVPLMVQTSWGNSPEYKPDKDKTLLNTKLDVVEFEGIVEEIATVEASNLKDDEIYIDITEGDAKNGKYEVIVDFDAEAIFGKEVKVWANDDDEIFFIEIKTDANDIFVDSIASDATNDVVELYVEDDIFDWASGAIVYLNLDTATKTELKAGMYGTFVLDNDGDVAFANVFDFMDSGVILEVDDEIIEYVALGDADEDEEIDFDDYDNVYVYNKDFTRASLDDLEEDVVFYTWEREEDGDDELFIVMVAEKVEGELERVKADVVRIDGTSYDVAAESIASLDNGDSFDRWRSAGDPIDVVEDLIGEEVIALLDFNGEVVFIEGDVETTSDTIYGIVTYAELGRNSEISVFTKDGEKDYIFEDRSAGIPFDPKDINYFGKASVDLEYAIAAFELNRDGEIDEEIGIDYIIVTGQDVTVPDDVYTNKGGFVELDKDDDDDYVVSAGGRYYISKDTVIMKATDDDELDPLVLDYDDIVEMSFTNQNAVVFGEIGRDADFIVFLEDSFSGFKEDVYYGIVIDSPYYDGDDYIAEIDVNAGAREFKVANKAYYDKGTMVAFKLDNDDEAVWIVYDDIDDDPADKLIDTVGDVDAEIVQGEVTGDGVDGSYIEVDGDFYKVRSDAVIYNIKYDDGWKLGGKIRLSKIDVGDEVSMLLNDSGRVASIMVYYEDDVDDYGSNL